MILIVQCIQCSLRRQDCVFSAPSKKRGRKHHPNDVHPPKRKKAPATSVPSTPTSATPENSGKLLSPAQLETMGAIHRGDTASLQPEALIDLILAQRTKIERKTEVLNELDVTGLFGTELSRGTLNSPFCSFCTLFSWF